MLLLELYKKFQYFISEERHEFMVYLLLIIGVLVGCYALYRFFLTATKEQIVALIKTAMFVIFICALLWLSVTGKLPAAIALLAAVMPFLYSWVQEKRKKKKNTQTNKTEDQKDDGDDKDINA